MCISGKHFNADAFVFVEFNLLWGDTVYLFDMLAGLVVYKCRCTFLLTRSLWATGGRWVDAGHWLTGCRLLYVNRFGCLVFQRSLCANALFEDFSPTDDEILRLSRALTSMAPMNTPLLSSFLY